MRVDSEEQRELLLKVVAGTQLQGSAGELSQVLNRLGQLEQNIRNAEVEEDDEDEDED